ncbi:Endonuclease/Exonuclease/phosphatase [Giardia duodenalis]|uniref:Endonuclease/Exonuclease/phosphatase n=1 Tax=Giardia intestinalis (strain ATCC 50803 / WB clone C6) TaxID=184922 RepID=A8BGE2_GIAIC|nr:Endonuclease/Exonuclease/phosphatase [Giardia intestinalis]KAE8302187.1 Endonuclease/Exonuclease/phosphatase [Giardia intestinalis]|eukprot:XP_001707172.1 Endonuclease/Exonuclease/phosphatase [Giardia lamblia ATCC 50803]
MPPAPVKMKKTSAAKERPPPPPYSTFQIGSDEKTEPVPFTILAINVNGIRSAFSKGLKDFIHKKNPDIVCFSETKLGSSAFAAFMEKEATRDPDTGVYTVMKGYKHVFCCSTAKQGYASTAMFAKESVPVLDLCMQMGDPEFDSEGRFLHVSLPSFELIHVYAPNSGRGSSGKAFTSKNRPANLSTRIKYEKLISKYIGNLVAAGKDVVYCGDLNVAHNEIDLYNPKSNHFSPGFTDEERNAFSKLLDGHGLIDAFRAMHPHRINYSWFSNFGRAREQKHGWRIDYFVVTSKIFKRVTTVDILDDYNSYSDHVPIIMTLTGI